MLHEHIKNSCKVNMSADCQWLTALTGEPFSPFTATPLPTPGGPCQQKRDKSRESLWLCAPWDVCAVRRVAGDGVTHPLSRGALFSLQKKRQIKVKHSEDPVVGNHANAVTVHSIIYTIILFCFQNEADLLFLILHKLTSWNLTVQFFFFQIRWHLAAINEENPSI